MLTLNSMQIRGPRLRQLADEMGTETNLWRSPMTELLPEEQAALLAAFRETTAAAISAALVMEAAVKRVEASDLLKRLEGGPENGSVRLASERDRR